jgi:urease alpha subunit
MLFNTSTPQIEIPDGTDPVLVDGTAVPITHADVVPLSRLHHLG